MHSARRISVHTQLIITVLLAIIVSWVLSTGMANYLMFRDARAIRAEMLKHPEVFIRPMREPHFGIREFFLGPPRGVAGEFRVGPPPRPGGEGPGPMGPGQQGRGPNPMGPPPPDEGRPPGPRQGLGPSILIIRSAIALIMALVAGTLLKRRFSRPLLELAEGAKSFHAGDFKHRIPLSGGDEFTQVAAAMNVMAERVSEQIADLEDDAKRRQQFLADVAHELRSPVTTLRTMAGALSEGLADDPERRTRAVQSLVNTSDRLLHLVSDLLELAKLDLQELPLHPREVELGELVSAAVQSHAASADNAGITMHPIQAGTPVTANVDPDRLTQVLDNLLDNAISYAGRGAEVKITVRGGDTLRVTVEDNGHGIAAKHLPYLFDPFYRADTARTPGDSHSGLGLRIARGLVEAHGGTLGIESTEGRGTLALITLPSDKQ